MDENIPTASTSTLSPASHSIRSGVITGAASVESVVMPTENATSPLQRNVMMLDETPPGQHPTRISPTPTAFGRPSPCTTPYARSGMSVNCAIEPIRMSNGRAARIRKSSCVSVSPIVSMIRPSRDVWTIPSLQSVQPNASGRK